MAHHPTHVVAARMRELRKGRWTAAQLAERMRAVGVEWDRSIIANLENGRRSYVTVEELLALAVVLDVAPVHLLVPTDSDEDYYVTPARDIMKAGMARNWIRGSQPPPFGDERRYRTQVPDEEWEHPYPMTADEKRRLARILEHFGNLLPPEETDDGRR